MQLPRLGGPTAASSRTGETFSASAGDFSALAALARERVAAVRAADRSAFLSTVDPQQPALLERQGVLYDNLHDLPLSSLSYDIGDFDLGDGPDLPGSDPELSPRVVEHLGLRGALARPVSNIVRQSFVRRDGAWRLGAESIDTEVRSATAVQDRPWGGPRIEVAQGDRVVVLTNAASVDASRLLTRIERESEAVERRLGAGACGPAGLLVDATRTGVPTEFNPVSREEATAEVITLLERRRRADGSDLERRAGPVMKLNPRLIFGASGNGGLLTHELTHVALAPWNRWVPLWLVEGVASWVESDDLRLPPYLPPTSVRALAAGSGRACAPEQGGLRLRDDDRLRPGSGLGRRGGLAWRPRRGAQGAGRLSRADPSHPSVPRGRTAAAPRPRCRRRRGRPRGLRTTHPGWSANCVNSTPVSTEYCTNSQSPSWPTSSSSTPPTRPPPKSSAERSASTSVEPTGQTPPRTSASGSPVPPIAISS